MHGSGSLEDFRKFTETLCKFRYDRNALRVPLPSKLGTRREHSTAHLPTTNGILSTYDGASSDTRDLTEAHPLSGASFNRS